MLIIQDSKKEYLLCYVWDQKIGEKTKENSAFDYILKPYLIADFSRTIKEALQR